MQRIRKKQIGRATIKIVIEKECPEGQVDKTLEAIQAEIKEGFERLSENIPHFDEVRIDKHGDMFTKKKREIPTPPEKEEK